MQIITYPDAATVATQAAEFIAEQARQAVAARGCFTLAVSGGQTPWEMLKKLATLEVPWAKVHLFQVDERVAPPEHADRNLTHLEASLLNRAPLPRENLHAMPVNEDDLSAAARKYAELLCSITGRPAVLDVIHLGLGADGHTASLVPGDGALAVVDQDVAICGVYQGRQRMTLTYPLLNRARHILWLATGAAKQTMLARLLKSDPTIPAGRVDPTHAIILADKSAYAG